MDDVLRPIPKATTASKALIHFGFCLARQLGLYSKAFIF